MLKLLDLALQESEELSVPSGQCNLMSKAGEETRHQRGSEHHLIEEVCEVGAGEAGSAHGDLGQLNFL